MYWVLFIVAFVAGGLAYWVYCLIVSDPSDRDAEVADMLDRIDAAETFVVGHRKKTGEHASLIEDAGQALVDLARHMKNEARV
jgi:hypothetical protein